MTVYALGLIKIHDRPTYNSYVAKFMPILIKYKGKLLAADEKPVAVEGHWDRNKVILLGFETMDDYKAWYESEEYQTILKDRHAATDGLVLVVQGP